MYQGPKSNKDGKHTCTVVCALVCDLAAVKPKELGMCRFRPWLLCMVILWEEVQESRSQDYSICPITTPCHCEPDDVINCSSRRLKKLPFFLEFYFVWADLNLSDNLLHQLPSDSLHSVKVRNLNLSKNILTLVHPQSFTGTQGVELLNLAHNYLSYLPPDMFLHLPEIKTLNLAYNRFKSLPDDVFTNAVTLQDLDLAGNELKTVPSAALRPLRTLHVLRARNNGIRVIPAEAFSDLPLDVLDLGDNHVPLQIYPRAFCGLSPRVTHVQAGVRDWSGLQTLLLDHNGLTHVDPCWSKIAWLLQTVDISGNPIVCDCDLMYLHSFSRQLRFPRAQCAGPEDFAGDMVDAIPQEKYNCSDFDTLEETSEKCDRQCRVTKTAMEMRNNAAVVIVTECFFVTLTLGLVVLI